MTYLNKSRSGQPLAESTKAKLSEAKRGANNPFYGKTHTDISKSKISKSLTGNTKWLGKSHTETTKLKISQSKLGKKWSEDAKLRLSLARKSSYKNYKYDANKVMNEYRKLAIDAYGYQCLDCKSSEGMLDVHHLDGDRENNELDNLCVLCRNCHITKAHTKIRDEKGKYIGSRINEDYKYYLKNLRRDKV